MPTDTERLDFLEAHAGSIIRVRSKLAEGRPFRFALAPPLLDAGDADCLLVLRPSLRALADAHLGLDRQESEIGRQWDEYFAAEG